MWMVPPWRRGSVTFGAGGGGGGGGGGGAMRNERLPIRRTTMSNSSPVVTVRGRLMVNSPANHEPPACVAAEGGNIVGIGRDIALVMSTPANWVWSQAKSVSQTAITALVLAGSMPPYHPDSGNRRRSGW